MTIKLGSSCKRYWQYCPCLFVFLWSEKWETWRPNDWMQALLWLRQLFGSILSHGHFLLFMLKKRQGLFLQTRACFDRRRVGTHTYDWPADWPVSQPIQSYTTNSLSFALMRAGMDAITKQMNTIYQSPLKHAAFSLNIMLITPYPIMLHV